MKWKLENVEMRAREHPETFEIMPLAERKGLEPGMFAKLIFLQGDRGERMWVEVKRRLGPGRYEGVLANNPFVIEGLEFGSIVNFEAKHVADVTSPGEAQGYRNLTMNGMFDAFEIWRSDTPRPEVILDESDPWFYAAPEEVKKRSRGRGAGPSSSLFSRPPEGRMERFGAESEGPKEWRPTRRFGMRPPPPPSYEGGSEY